ncbi:dynamin family protein [Xenococcus sp. PCC 7305]|uniref:dynamin family protein n=1 Tax=Xenococcus sp. PCC 7305 TaxID=102125 RepID=UPI0002AC8FFE|nr:dynamin family protein [Xenococcus sp. PCC 7305]ELS01319.1 dynamin family protein [Xenococcus sp. PCC 7305]
MVDTTPKTKTRKRQPKIENLQQEVIDLLADICTLVGDTQTSLVNNESPSKYSQFQEQFSAASHNVSELQLRMSIVAPMKAGKSTIINAIAGQELLPSCATAMTTLPTEITFSTDIQEPILTIPNTAIEIFQEIYQDTKLQLNKFGIESLQDKLARYPHLMHLLGEVRKTKQIPLEPKIVGRTAINKTLNRLNHLIRLYSVIEPLKDPLGKFTEIPQITTPFLGISGTSQARTLGNLVIVDTPGPNEAGESLKLTAVVEEQLRRSSVILVVLDYTQLNNEAAETIKRQINPILELIGKDNLYVIVNKVDQRRKGDMTTEQVKNFVAADLELSQDNISERVFEISAIRAFAATQFLLEVQQNPKIKLLEIKSLETVAQEIFGIDWDEEIEDVTVKFLAQKALKLWKKSGFAPFLEKAIASLMETAAPRCLLSALNLSRYRLLELKDDISLRSNAITQDAVKLQDEITALEKDLAYLESCRNNLQQIEEIKNRLQYNLEIILVSLKNQATITLEDYFTAAEYQEGDAIKKVDMQARKLLLTNLGDFELFPKWITKKLKENLENTTSGIIPFKTEQQAEAFTQKTLVWAKARFENLMLSTRKDIETEISQTNHNLIELLTKETQPIIKRAKGRLQANFEISLELPIPDLNIQESLNLDKNSLIKKNTHLIEGDFDERVVKKRAWYYWFGVVPFYTTESYQKPYKKENYYTVSLEEVVATINVSSDNFVENIKIKIVEHFEGNLKDQVELFFGRLDNYLNGYLENLQQAQADHLLSLEQREELIQNLNKLEPETKSYLQKTDDYLQLTGKFLS